MRPLPLALACLALLGAQAAAVPSPEAQELLFRRLPPLTREEGRRAPVTVTPAVTFAEEFNDNIFVDNDSKAWDFITFISPSLTLEIEQPTFRLLASYDFAAAFYARHPEENRAFDQQNFVLDAEWKPTPRLALFASDTFTYTTDTNAVATEGVATGRDTSWSNGFAAGGSYELDQKTVLRASGSVIGDDVLYSIGGGRAVHPARHHRHRAPFDEESSNRDGTPSPLRERCRSVEGLLGSPRRRACSVSQP